VTLREDDGRLFEAGVAKAHLTVDASAVLAARDLDDPSRRALRGRALDRRPRIDLLGVGRAAGRGESEHRCDSETECVA
jgi:hypothetical protein